MTKAVNYFYAGAMATIPMTLVMMYLYDKLPVYEKTPLPPRKISMNLAEKAGVKWLMDEEEKETMTVLGHFSYGAVSGAAYYPIANRIKAPSVVTGMVYGVSMWAISYLGLMPALGLHKNATKEPAERNAMMIISHLVWGASLGFLKDIIDRKNLA